jgi:hypothetical protein
MYTYKSDTIKLNKNYEEKKASSSSASSSWFKSDKEPGLKECQINMYGAVYFDLRQF